MQSYNLVLKIPIKAKSLQDANLAGFLIYRDLRGAICVGCKEENFEILPVASQECVSVDSETVSTSPAITEKD